MAERALLKTEDAKSEGARRLRDLVRRMTFGAIALRLRVDESAVRLWARERRKPTQRMRVRWREEFGWDERIWDAPPSEDVYVTSEPATIPRE